MRIVAGIVLGAVLVLPGLAQESPSYILTEYTFDAGGSSHGNVLSSPSYSVALVSVGGNVDSAELGSVSYQAHGGFVAGYRTPGEVHGLLFTDQVTLVWSPEPSAGNYSLYRDLMSTLATLAYGTCYRGDIVAVTHVDPDQPPTGDGYFYLVTVRNRLEAEGPKGWDSDGVVRPNATPCP